MLIDVQELEVLRVKAGDVLILRVTAHVPAETMERLRQHVKKASEESGAKMVVIEYGLEVVAAVEDNINGHVAFDPERGLLSVDDLRGPTD